MNRLAAPVVVTVTLAMGTLALWGALRQSNIDQIGRIAEAESWAARSQLVRQIDTMLSALDNAGSFWAAYAHLPSDAWSEDAGIELEHFEGLALIIWDDQERDIRFARTAEHESLNYRPGDDEWAEYVGLVSRARDASSDTMTGPFTREDGSKYFEIFFVKYRSGAGGTLAAILNVQKSFERMLADESPGYAIRIYADKDLLFERGAPDPDAPETWVRSGKIQPALGRLWTVEHIPKRELTDSFRWPSIDFVLLLGLVIAVLMGTLVYENSRARSRAVAAETAEGELAELARELEHKVAVRTADLRTLADSVAHDLRNPLNTMLVNVRLLEERFGDDIGDDGRKMLARLQPPVSQMAEILERLLGLTEASNSVFERSEIDMRELAEEVVGDLLAAEREPRPEVHIGNLPTVRADRKLLQMLLINLVGNAFKYTRDKSDRRILIDYGETERGKAFRVRDNGVGFERACADRLFVAFERVEESTSAEGIGLGLTIAARVIERHGGTIWAEGEPGEGATFYFTLPDD